MYIPSKENRLDSIPREYAHFTMTAEEHSLLKPSIWCVLSNCTFFFIHLHLFHFIKMETIIKKSGEERKRMKCYGPWKTQYYAICDGEMHSFFLHVISYSTSAFIKSERCHSYAFELIGFVWHVAWTSENEQKKCSMLSIRMRWCKRSKWWNELHCWQMLQFSSFFFSLSHSLSSV